jgi:hypothetical protein
MAMERANDGSGEERLALRLLRAAGRLRVAKNAAFRMTKVLGHRRTLESKAEAVAEFAQPKASDGKRAAVEVW